jgi:hypothetical protein
MIIPAPAVKFVAESIRMKLPVSRFCPYGSKSSGRVVVMTALPISFSVAAVHFRRDRSGVVLDQIHPARIEGPFIHPHDVRLDAVGDLKLGHRPARRPG